MRKIKAILGENDVMKISEGLKIFIPQFSDKYVIEVIISESKEDEVIKIIKENGTVGKIFVSEVLRAIDIATGKEGEETI